MKQAFIVTSVASMIDQFNIPIIQLLQGLEYEVIVGSNFEKGSSCTEVQIDRLKAKLDSFNVKYYQIDFERNLFNLRAHFSALKQIKEILKKNHFDLIHCQSPMGGILTRIAARKYRNKDAEIIYTAHGFHFYKGAPLKNWILFYPLEKFFSRLTDKLITLNKEDFDLASKKMHAPKIYYVKGVGVNTEKFTEYVLSEKDKLNLLRELDVDNNSKIILSVGELNDNKNHKVVIKALQKVNDSNIHYVIAGKGDKKDYLMKLANEYNVNLHLIGFRDDLIKWYKLCDLFVLPSFREGLAVSLLEAIASNSRVIASDIRGNRDVVDKSHLFSPKDDIKLASLIDCTLKENKPNQKTFDFDLKNILEEMEKIYTD